MSSPPPTLDSTSSAPASMPVAAQAIDSEITTSAADTVDGGDPAGEQGGASASSLQPPPATAFKKGHAPKPSVGIAASLFGSSGDDDPFSSISASHAALSLSQLTENEDEEEEAAADIQNAHEPIAAEQVASADPVASLFGAAEPAAVGDSLAVPTADGKTSGPSSGPASPGGLFADSSYQDDWLASGADQSHTDAAADPFAATDGGQGSLSWLNQDGSQHPAGEEPQYDAYGRPIGQPDSDIVGYDQDGYDHHQQQQQQAYGFDQQQGEYAAQQSYDYQQQGYDQQSYDQQSYGQQAYDQQAYDQQAYDQQAYDQQAYDQQAYDQQAYSQQGYDGQTYDQQAYDSQGYDQQAYAQQGYDQTSVYGQADYTQPSQEQQSYDPQTYANQAASDPYAPAASNGDASAQTYTSDYAPNQHGQDGSAYDQQTSSQYDQAGSQYDAANYGQTQDYGQQTQSYDSNQTYAASAYAVHATEDSYAAVTGAPEASAYPAYTPDEHASQSTQGQQASSDPYAYDPYAPQQHPPRAEQHADPQAWSHQNYSQGDAAEAPSSTDYSAAAHDAGASSAGALATAAAAYARAASPYDPPAATSPIVDAPNQYAARSSSAQSATLPPPPKGPPSGPPKGPPRGPPRGSSRASSRNAHSISATSTPPATDASVARGRAPAVSLEQESQEFGWSNDAATEQSQPSQQSDVAATPPPAYKRPASAWVDSLEQAAATPPPSSGDDSLPTLTVTDESGDAEHGDYAAQQHDHVQDATDAFGQLNLDHEQHDSMHADGYAPEAERQQGAYDAQNAGSAASGEAQGSSWNAYGEEDQPSSTTSYDPYAPPAAHQGYDSYNAYGVEHPSANERDPASLYDAEGGNNTGGDEQPFAAHHAFGEEDHDARTPLASRGETGSWLNPNSESANEGASDAYSPMAGSNDPYAPSVTGAAVPDSSYSPYGPPAAQDPAADPYAAPPSQTHAHQFKDPEAEDPYAASGYQRDLPQESGYFDPQQRASSPQQYPYGNTHGLPPSPYDPHDQYGSNAAGADQGAQSVASETRSQAASDTSADMLQTMRSATIPIASFGIGGKLVSYFPTSRGTAGASGDANASANDANVYGSYSYNASSYPTTVDIRAMSSLVPSSAYASAFDPLTFPGPVFEGAAGTTALSRATGASSAQKTKKAALIKHLDERVQELSAGVGYLRRRPSFSGPTAGSNRGAPEQDAELDARRTEDKILLLRLLKLLVENDGQTSSAAFEQGVRSLIVAADAPDSATSSGFAMSVAGESPTEEADGSVVTSHELRTGFLQKLQGMLLRGDRRQAVEYAVAHKMWAHAMTIASCVDKECWKQVVSDFIEQEVGAAETSLSGQGRGDLQGLKVAYNVFSGQDPVSIFDLFRTKTQLAPAGGLQASAADAGAASASLPSWKESAAIVASHRSPSDSAALTAIGDGLCTRGLLEAAHFCYLLSPQTSPMGGADTTGVRFTLLGQTNPKASAAFVQDLDGILLTEVLEFAQGLVPAVKGQEPFAGIAHLQAYKLVHAHQLADLGEVGRAQKYCEAIAQCLKQTRQSPYLHPTLLSQSKQLSDRLLGAPQAGAGGNWMTRKMQRPTLDGVWGALEGRFTKFIAGEDGATEGESPNKNSKGSVSSSVGPFSHYSAITPDAASGGMTRQQSFTELHAGSPSGPSSRAGSAMDFRNATKRAASPKHRASSALSMRPLHQDAYGDWPQQRPSFNGNGGHESGSNYDRDSVRSSSEAPRHAYGYGANLHAGQGFGHGQQTSEFSTASSTYGGGAETSFTSETTPWPGHGGAGGREAESSGRPSTDAARPSGGSEAGYGGGYGDYSGYGGYGGGSGYGGYGGSQAEEGGGEEGGDTSGYSAPGQAPFYGYDPHGAQKPEFVSNVDGAGALEDGDGFVSPFDALSSNSRTPQPQANQYAPSSYSRNQQAAEEDLDDDDDLGLGNSSRRNKASGATERDGDAGSAGGDVSRQESVSSATSGAAGKEDGSNDGASAASEEKRQELKSSASWFGRLWGRSSSTDSAAQQAQAKAKKAHLGEETSFVYDKELKRWVNKKVGESAGAASTPPPPPPPARAQTASPASQPDRSAGASSAPPMRGPPSGSFTMGRATPPISEGRDEGSSGLAPSRGPPGMGSLTRARSNLADHSMPPASQPPMGARGSGSSTPAGLASPPAPPPGGSRTGTVKKRPIKSRYVVVD